MERGGRGDIVAKESPYYCRGSGLNGGVVEEGCLIRGNPRHPLMEVPIIHMN